MLINGVDVSTYHAKLLNKNIQTAEITIFDDWLRNALNPLYLGKHTTFKNIKMQLVISGATNNACLEYLSALVSALAICTVKFDNIDFYYKCTLASKESYPLVEDGYFGLDVELKSGYAYKAEITETLDHVLTKTVTNLGNLPSPAKVTITVPINTAVFTLSGFGEDNISIFNLLANVPVIIDGELGTVLQNGSNKFGETDLWAFPLLIPGANLITLDHDTGIVSVSYKPKFV